MEIQIIAVPYDSGQREARMGRGPTHLAAQGADRLLGEAGFPATVEVVESEDTFLTEIGTTFRLHSLVAGRVSAARAAGRFPIVLGGNCGTASIGTVAALGDAPTGVIWFDAHGDFNTPETTVSGFLDGMPLAVITGRCWTALARRIPGFEPMPENRVIHAGGRDLDPAENEQMQSSNMCVLTPERIGHVGIVRALAPGLDYIGMNVRRAYLHIDMDILDPAEGRANSYAAPGGLRLADLQDAIRQIGAHLPLVAAGIASYDPAADVDGRAAQAGLALMRTIAETAAAASPGG